MILKKLFYGIFGFVFSCQLFSQQTQVIFLSGTDAANTVQWDFYCTEGQNSKKWTKIEVPSNWELQGFGTYNYGHDWKNKAIVLGKEVGWYKHSFEVPVGWKEKEITIVFDGAMTDTEVKVNGISAGSIHQGGFTRFTYNITELVKFGKKNVLEVKVLKHSKNESVNKAERQADFWIFGGIYRPVFLEVSPKQHINNIAIDAKANGQFNAVARLNSSKEDCVLSIDLFDVEGEKVGETIQTSLKKGVLEKNISGRFEPVKAWNPEWPHLYDMKFTLSAGKKVIHEVTKRIGFRTVELRKHDGFYINGERIVFKGVNRHSFWPETGRSLSEENHLTDMKLMKEMNMNAVRSSHYEPDERFLALCDSLGLFVLDEVAGWQDGYDTIVGPKVIKEMVLKDQNHPSVVIWDHGNEGGWNFENEKWLSYWDLQKRPIIYPWLLRNGVDAYHYPEYNYATTRFVSGNDPFMATELLHGLYDGGAGAGLDEYWRNYETSPLFAGGFLWVFTDEAVLRKDKVGVFYDSDNDHAPDGILGPHREKEASFYTIKEVWSPVQINPVTINKDWNGKLIVNNKFKFTNLNQCSFRWSALKFTIGSTKDEIVGSGSIPSPNAAPGEASSIFVNCKETLNNADVLTLTAIDPHGAELYTWRWPIVQPKEKALELFKNETTISEVAIFEKENTIEVSANNVKIIFDKHNGKLLSAMNSKGYISFSSTPFSSGKTKITTSVVWRKDNKGAFNLEINNNDYPEKMTWTFYKNGLLHLEASPINKKREEFDFIGISFDYPEDKCLGIKWMGRGPYRVWKNRIKGSDFGAWEKKYNNTVTGQDFNDLIYPEFKGYHANLYWMTLETTESPITIITQTPNLYFQLFHPQKANYASQNVTPPFPEGDISFLYDIPAIGTKFKKADQLGSKGQKGFYSGHDGDQGYPIQLWFDFRKTK